MLKSNLGSGTVHNFDQSNCVSFLRVVLIRCWIVLMNLGHFFTYGGRASVGVRQEGVLYFAGGGGGCAG